MRFPRGLPERPAVQGAALLALHRLDAAAAAAKRLPVPDDAEALHDFRVGLRRLRTLLRSYGEALEGRVRRKTVKAVRRLGRDTNSARDTEVLESLLKGWEGALQPSHRPGWNALLARLVKTKPADLRGFITRAIRSFRGVEADLRAGLAANTGPTAAESSEPEKPARSPGRTFGALSADLLRKAGRVLATDLAAIKSPSDDEPVHEARIAGKRLRYLLEPFQSRSFPCRKAVGKLKKLQDDLGEIHDLNLAIRAARRCAKKEAGAWSLALVDTASDRSGKPGRPAATSESNPIPGLVQISSLAGRDRASAFSRFSSRWDQTRAESFFREIETVAKGLSAKQRARPAPAASSPPGGPSPAPPATPAELSL
ncbi:MAG: CHAD domain-containing protein [Elusimicrobia bacterium]|nr:CHAD domain-containing protein [Elusimicrobiota bacterium]